MKVPKYVMDLFNSKHNGLEPEISEKKRAEPKLPKSLIIMFIPI